MRKDQAFSETLANPKREGLKTLKVPGFKLFNDRHGTLRCYHRASRTPVDLNAYPIGTSAFYAHCADLVNRSVGREKRKPELIYLIACHDFVKIGIASDVKSRLAALALCNPYPLSVVAACPGGLADEKSLHEKFKAYRTRGEWFKVEGELASFMKRPSDNLRSHILQNQPGPDDMQLPTGVTCGDCVHLARCKAMFGHVETDTYCDWSPSRFQTRRTV